MPDEQPKAYSQVGQLILSTIASKPGLTRAAVTRGSGINHQLFWAILLGRRSVPFARMEDLAKALQLNEEETNALISADHADRRARRRSTTDTTAKTDA